MSEFRAFPACWPSLKQLKVLKVVELKARLKALGLPATGLKVKDDFVDRLDSHFVTLRHQYKQKAIMGVAQEVGLIVQGVDQTT